MRAKAVRIVAVVGLFLLGTAGCQQQEPNAPTEAVLLPVLAGVLQDTGLYREPRITRLVGQRYIPGLNEWQVVACFDHGPDDAPQTACEDGLRVLPMGNGSWVVSVDHLNIHRWRELAAPAASSN